MHRYQLAAISSSETNEPTGLPMERCAIVSSDSPRRYIRYAATAPAINVPQKNALLMSSSPKHNAHNLRCKTLLMSIAS